MPPNTICVGNITTNDFYALKAQNPGHPGLLGPPQATDFYTQSELSSAGLMGLYMPLNNKEI